MVLILVASNGVCRIWKTVMTTTHRHLLDFNVSTSAAMWLWLWSIITYLLHIQVFPRCCCLYKPKVTFPNFHISLNFLCWPFRVCLRVALVYIHFNVIKSVFYFYFGALDVTVDIRELREKGCLKCLRRNDFRFK